MDGLQRFLNCKVFEPPSHGGAKGQKEEESRRITKTLNKKGTESKNG